MGRERVKLIIIKKKNTHAKQNNKAMIIINIYFAVDNLEFCGCCCDVDESHRLENVLFNL